MLHYSAHVQVMSWELLTRTKFYGQHADMAAVVDTLLGARQLPSEQQLTAEVASGPEEQGVPGEHPGGAVARSEKPAHRRAARAAVDQLVRKYVQRRALTWCVRS